MKKFKRICSALLILSILICSLSAVATAATITIKSLSVSPSSLTINEGSSITNAGTIVLTAKYSDGSTAIVTNDATWQISNTSIANLPGDGTIKGIKAGNTKLTLSYGGKSTSISIKVVKKAIKSLSVSPSNLTINEGSSITNAGTIVLTANYSDGSTAIVTNDATWKISKTSIAKLPGDGTIKGLKAGNTNLTLSYGGKSATIAIQVNASTKMLKSLSATPSNLSISVGNSIRIADNIVLTANYSDGSAAIVTNDATWKISKTSIAKLPGDGTIKGLKAGNTNLTLSYGGKTASIAINVVQEKAIKIITPSIIKSIITGKIQGTFSMAIDVDAMTTSIYSDIEEKIGLSYVDDKSLENIVVDSLTTRVGVTGLFSFVDESNAILDKEWNIIYDSLGIPRSNANAIGLGDKRYFNLVCYDLKKGSTIKYNFSATNEYMALDGTTSVAKYKFKVYKDGDWFPTYEISAKTGDTVTGSFVITSPGQYYVTISREDLVDICSIIKCNCTLTQ